MRISWCLKGLTGMDQLLLPIKTSEKEKGRKKRIKTHRPLLKATAERHQHLGNCSLCGNR